MVGMVDLLPGDKVRISDSRNCGQWAGLVGTVTWASDAHGLDRVLDIAFDDLPSSTFVASECVAA